MRNEIEIALKKDRVSVLRQCPAGFMNVRKTDFEFVLGPGPVRHGVGEIAPEPFAIARPRLPLNVRTYAFFDQNFVAAKAQQLCDRQKLAAGR